MCRLCLLIFRQYIIYEIGNHDDVSLNFYTTTRITIDKKTIKL